MATKSDTKHRILALERIIQKKREVTVEELLRILDREYDIKADRKTLYDDIAALTFFMPIDVVGRGVSHKYVLTEFGEGI